MVEQIAYNITMVALLSCWVGTSYFVAKYDDEDNDDILMVRQNLKMLILLILRKQR